MEMQLEDRVVIDAKDVRITKDGYLVAMPRVARTGIQLYTGDEMGKPEMEVVRVYRPEAEVFNKDSMHSFAFRPITDNHPPVQVDSKNWKDFASGLSGGEVARDGEFLRVPMTVMDQTVINKYNDGKAELSVGYTADIKWQTGTDPGSGMQYDAIQTNIRANHIAVVDAARGGKKLRIGDRTQTTSLNEPALQRAKDSIASGAINVEDEVPGSSYSVNNCLGVVTSDAGVKYAYPFAVGDTVHRRGLTAIKQRATEQGNTDIADAATSLLELLDQKEKDMNDKTKIVDVDGVNVEMSDIAAAVVTRRVASLEKIAGDLRQKLEASEEAAKKKGAEDAKTIADLQTVVTTKDAELTTVKKQLDDSKLTPAQLDAMVKDRELVIGKAKTLMGGQLVSDGKSEADIRREVVNAKLGDAAKGWSDDQVKVSFDTLTAGVEITTDGVNAIARSFSAPGNNAADAKMKPYDAYDSALQNRWQGETAAKH